MWSSFVYQNSYFYELFQKSKNVRVGLVQYLEPKNILFSGKIRGGPNILFFLINNIWMYILKLVTTLQPTIFFFWWDLCLVKVKSIAGTRTFSDFLNNSWNNSFDIQRKITPTFCQLFTTLAVPRKPPELILHAPLFRGTAPDEWPWIIDVYVVPVFRIIAY